MEAFVLVNPGLEEICGREIKELTGVKTGKCKIYNSVIWCELAAREDEIKEKLLSLSSRLRSARRLLLSLGGLSLGGVRNLNDWTPNGYNWQSFLPQKFSFKVEVEGVKGQENRTEISKAVAGKFFDATKLAGITPSLELKKPELLLLVYFNGTEYFTGIDFCVKELNSREYRIFAHQASFKGDFAYFFARSSGFVPGKKLLVGFAKDGAVAIEAALFAKDKSSSQKISIPQKIFAFDESQGNVTAARKNSKLAGAHDFVEFRKLSLDELDVQFEEGYFDNVIFHVTSKDEEKLNEIYYQSKYILKKKGLLLLIGRNNWNPPLSARFKLLGEIELQRGESIIKTWLLEKI